MTLYAFAIETTDPYCRWWNRALAEIGVGREESELDAAAFASAAMDRWLEHLAEPSQDYERMYPEDTRARAVVWDVDRVAGEVGDDHYLSRPEEFTPRRYVELLDANKVEADVEVACPAATVGLAVVRGLKAWDDAAR